MAATHTGPADQPQPAAERPEHAEQASSSAAKHSEHAEQPQAGPLAATHPQRMEQPQASPRAAEHRQHAEPPPASSLGSCKLPRQLLFGSVVNLLNAWLAGLNHPHPRKRQRYILDNFLDTARPPEHPLKPLSVEGADTHRLVLAAITAVSDWPKGRLHPAGPLQAATASSRAAPAVAAVAAVRATGCAHSCGSQNSARNRLSECCAVL